MKVANLEVLKGPFGSTADLLRLVNNLDVREPLRRFRAPNTAIFVDRKGAVVLVVRIKGALGAADLGPIRERECPGAFYVVVEAGRYTAESELHQRIDECAQAYEIAGPATGIRERMVDGKMVLEVGLLPDTQRRKRR